MGWSMIVHLRYTMRDLDFVFNVEWGPDVEMDSVLFRPLWDSLYASFGRTVSSRGEICGKFPVYGDMGQVVQTSELLSKILYDCGLKVRPKNGPFDVRMLKNHAWRLSSYTTAWSTSLQKMMVAENLSTSTGKRDLIATTNSGSLFYVVPYGGRRYVGSCTGIEAFCEARRSTSRSSWDLAKGVIAGRIHDPLRMPGWVLDMIRSTNASGVGDTLITRHHDVVPP